MRVCLKSNSEQNDYAALIIFSQELANLPIENRSRYYTHCEKETCRSCSMQSACRCLEL